MPGNNFPKITRTSKSVRGLKPCYIVLYFLFCVSCLLNILGNQININFLKKPSVVGLNTVLFPEGSATQDTVCLYLFSSIHTLSTHTTPQKRNILSDQRKGSSLNLGENQNKKTPKNKKIKNCSIKVRVRVSNSFSVLVYFNHILTSCHLLSLSFICSRYFCSCS